MSAPVIIGNATSIYALCDESGIVRYVGKTVRTPQQRFAQHKTAARKSELPVGRWLRKHPAATVKLLEVVAADMDWAAREAYWIAAHSNLLNLTNGGEGLAGHIFSQEHRSKIGTALKTGEHFNCEQCNIQFWRKRNEIEKGDCRFCSRPCYARSLKGQHRPLPELAIKRGVEAAAKARRARTNCKRGHLLSGPNLFFTSSGGRGCKECRKIHKATYRSKANG